MLKRCVTAGLALLLLTARARAQESESDVGSDSESQAFELEVHAFVSQGFLISTHNNYLADSTSGSFEFSEVGINFSKSLGDKLRVGLQLFARDLGPIGRYNARFDWFYLDYRHHDWLGIRAGRVKLPFGLYNEYNDIDAGRTAVLLPQSMYPVQNRELLLSQTGVEIYGRIAMHQAGALEYRLYGGTVFFEVEPQSNSRLENVEVPYIAGARVLWDTPLPGLRLGGSAQALRLQGDIVVSGAAIEATRMAYMLGPEFDGRIGTRLTAMLWVGSVEYTFQDLLLAAEYSRWHLGYKTDITLPALKPEVVQERAYVLASYRVNGWFQPGVYYSLYFPDVDLREGREHQLHDFAASVRFDITPYWLVKLEGHSMHGTADLSTSLNDGKTTARMTQHWALFLVKTTAYF